MAIYHRATLTPTKLEAVAGWIPSQAWGSAGDADVEIIGAYRFDDPNGQVGMEVHLAGDGVDIFHVPFTYRDAPLDGAESALVCEMEHSALGTRWVYDGLRDPLFVTMLAAVTMTGQGQAVGMVDIDGRMVVVPTNVRLEGGGWSLERVPVDGFTSDDVSAASPVFHNDRFELVVHRRPVVAPRSPICLTATWPEQPAPVVLAEMRER
jgi:hypothetical protein